MVKASCNNFIEAKSEYNKPMVNTIINKANYKDTSMKQAYKECEMEIDDLQVLLQFPKKSKGDDYIENELKNIIKTILKVYITNI